MEKTILEIIYEVMTGADINYHYISYDPEGSGPVYPYVTGEYTEYDFSYEDGHTRGEMLLEVWTRGTELDLIDLKTKIKKLFENYQVVKDHTAVLISYMGKLPVRTGDMTLKKMQITLAIEAWESEVK